MRPAPAALVLALVCSSTLALAADIGFQKTLTASGPVALNVCSNSGLIHITGVDGSKIQISAKVHKSNWHAVGNTTEMKQVAANPPVHQTGNAVQVGDNTTCGANLLHDIDIDYEISIPKNSTVVAKSGLGNIRVESVSGFVHVATGSGDVVANGVGSGSRLATGSGTLDIQAAHGMLQAETSSGNVSIRDSDVTEARLATNSGSITAINLKGGVRASTLSGNLFMGGLPTSAWQMRTNNGAIHFQAEANAKFSLDAETGNGTIESSLPSPLSGHVINGALRGPVGGGGPEVKMYTSNGNIDLK